MFLMISFVAVAFEGSGVAGARSAAMGRASVTLSDFWSIQNNPAGIAMMSNPAAGIYYENRFLMKELAMKSGAFVLPVRFGVLGVSFNQFGYSLYNENKLGIAYARAFSDQLRIGVQLDYLTTQFGDGYESTNNITFELGVQSDITKKITVGAFIFNPVKARLSSYTDERVPVIMRFGVTYHFTEKLFGIAEIEKNFDLKPGLRTGFEYTINQTFYARIGLSTQPGLLTFGSGFRIGNLNLDLSAGMHQVLGVSAQAGLIYHFGSK